MKKALIISPIPSHPQDQGNRRRIYDICRAMKSKGYLVHFIWYAHEWGGVISDENYSEMLSAWDQLHVVPINPKRQNYKTIDEKTNIDSLWYDGIADMIKWCSLNHEYEIAITTYAMYSKALLEFKGTKTVTILDTQDVLTDRHLMLKRQGVGKQFYSTSSNEEKKAIKRADIVLAIQDVEEAHFRSLGHKNALTISYSNPEVKSAGTSSGHTVAGSIGSNTNINVESCRRLISAIEEHKNTLPDKFVLVLAGSMCKGIDWPLPDYVKLLGHIEGVNEFYDQLDLVIVPVEFGSGLKIKAVEALSYGLPVLATQHSFIGIESEYSEHSFKSVNDLASSLGAIISDKEKLSELEGYTQKVYDTHHKLVQSQFEKMFSLIGDLSRKKRTLSLDYDSGKILKNYNHIYIYGGGAGCQLLLSTMPSSEREKIRGIIDIHKTGVGHYDIPLMHWNNISREIRNDCLVILSLTSTEQYKVHRLLKRKGFSKIVNAFSFIAKRLFLK